MNEISIEESLEINPKVRKIFEENAKKLGARRNIYSRGTGYGLGLPYGGRKSRQYDQTDKNSPAVVSYQRF